MPFSEYQSMLSWQYRNWLKVLLDSGGHFLTPKMILDGRGISKDQCNLLIRHDMDGCHFVKNVAPVLALEHSLGVRSCTYLFANDENVVEKNGRPSFEHKDYLHFLQESGFEFGLHVDVFDRVSRLGQDNHPEESMAVIAQDRDFFREEGIDLRSMTAHGRKFSDGTKAVYDNYAAELDYTQTFGDVVGQFHLYEAFCEQGGRLISDALGLDRALAMKSTIMPGHKDYREYWHPRSDVSWFRHEILSLSDASGFWKYLGVLELAALLPQLKGCLVVLSVHPFWLEAGDDGFEYAPRKLSNDDALHLPSGLVFPEPPKSPTRLTPRMEKLTYKGKIDFSKVTMEEVGGPLTKEKLNELRDVLVAVNEELQAGPWFNYICQLPNPTIIRWLDEFLPLEGRQEKRILEICGGMGPATLGLSFFGFLPKNAVIGDINESYLEVGRRFHPRVFEEPPQFRYLDLLDMDIDGGFDIVVISGWEQKCLPYATAVANIAEKTATGGFLCMTFHEQSRILSEGYDFSVWQLMAGKQYPAITPDDLADIFLANDFEPIAYLDHGYPHNRFPRHVLIGRKRDS